MTAVRLAAWWTGTTFAAAGVCLGGLALAPTTTEDRT